MRSKKSGMPMRVNVLKRVAAKVNIPKTEPTLEPPKKYDVVSFSFCLVIRVNVTKAPKYKMPIMISIVIILLQY